MDLVHVQTGFTHEAFMGGRHKHLANGDMQKEQALTLGVLSTFRYSASWLF